MAGRWWLMADSWFWWPVADADGLAGGWRLTVDS